MLRPPPLTYLSDQALWVSNAESNQSSIEANKSSEMRIAAQTTNRPFYRCALSRLACVSQKTRKLYGPEKPFVKLRPAYFVRLVFSYVVKGIKIKITAKFCDTEHLRFEDTKRIMSPENFRDFRETGP